jgi:hypothetical protein
MFSSNSGYSRKRTFSHPALHDCRRKRRAYVKLRRYNARASQSLLSLGYRPYSTPQRCCTLPCRCWIAWTSLRCTMLLCNCVPIVPLAPSRLQGHPDSSFDSFGDCMEASQPTNGEEDAQWRDTLKRKWHQRQTDVFAVSEFDTPALGLGRKVRFALALVRCALVFCGCRSHPFVLGARTCRNAT